MKPRDIARGLGFTRLGVGIALMIAPRAFSSLFLGRHARGPATGFYARATGARDIVMGGLALHTVDHPQVGPRYVAAAAAVDAADVVAAFAIRDEVGAKASLALLLAASGAIGGAYAARGLQQQPPASA